jgi:hypothetical protein
MIVRDGVVYLSRWERNEIEFRTARAKRFRQSNVRLIVDPSVIGAVQSVLDQIPEVRDGLDTQERNEVRSKGR